MTRRITQVLLLLGLIATACGSADGAATTATDAVEVPRFVSASGSLAELAGTSFRGDSLPADLGGNSENPLGGAALVPGDANADLADQQAIHWFVDGDHANFTVSNPANDATEPTRVWNIVSAHRLELGADMVLTTGPNVCMAPIHTYDWQNGVFVAVTNRAQDQALGAWTVSENGAAPYAELDTLVCERFTP